MPNLDLTHDLAAADGGETVTIVQAGTLAEQSAANAVRRAVSLGEIEASGGTFTHGDFKFHVPAVGLSFVPAAADTLTDAATRQWDILAVDLLAMQSRYRLWCRASSGGLG